MKKDIYSKENLEGLANALLNYLYNTISYRDQIKDFKYKGEEISSDELFSKIINSNNIEKSKIEFDKEKLSDDVFIYTLNKRYSVDEKNFTYKFNNTPILVQENIKVEDYLEYYNKKTLTFSMDSILSEYLYNQDVPGCKKVINKIDEIFKKHGFYMDFGSNVIVFANNCLQK